MINTPSEFKAGAARVRITPPVGVGLSGFVARTQASTGIADELHVRAVVLQSASGRLALLQFDLLGLSDWQVAEIRHRAWKRCGILPWNLMLSTTHTHSGPGIVAVRGCEAAEPAYVWKVIESAIQSLAAAIEDLKPAEPWIAAVPYRLGINRRVIDENGQASLGFAPDLPAPGKLDVLTFERAGAPPIWIFSHAAHPYILGGESLLISGDFPSASASQIEASTSGAIAVFLNGCAGDISPLGAFEGVERLSIEGERLAAAVLNSRHTAIRISPLPLLGDALRIPLTYAPLPEAREIDALLGGTEKTVRPEERSNPEVQARIRAAYADWAYHLRRICSGQEPLTPLIAEVQKLRIGELTLIGISGEPFWETGEKLKQFARAQHAWSLGYCNAYSGYLPPAAAVPQGGYEVDESWRYLGTWRLDAGAEPHLVEESHRRLFGHAGAREA